MKNNKSKKNYQRFNLEQLRKTDFTKFINTRIVEVGDKQKTHCPFHEENNPSFFIYPENSYFCFGCGAHGNAIDFMMEKFGYSFEMACSILEDL